MNFTNANRDSIFMFVFVHKTRLILFIYLKKTVFSLLLPLLIAYLYDNIRSIFHCKNMKSVCTEKCIARNINLANRNGID